MTTTKLRAGLYRTVTGHTVEAAEDMEGRVYGWHLTSPEGEWMQTYTTKRAALADLEELLTTEATPAEPVLERVTGEDATPDVTAYVVYLGGVRIGTVRRGRDRWQGIGDCYNPWEALSAHRSHTGRSYRGTHETRTRAVRDLVGIHTRATA